MKLLWTSFILMVFIVCTLSFNLPAIPADSQQKRDNHKTSVVPLSRLEEFGPYKLPSEVGDLHVVIKTDLGILIPEFNSFPKNDSLLTVGIAGGSEEVAQFYKPVIQEMGWGHAVLYIYDAIYHSLGRIYYGISLDILSTGDIPLISRQFMKKGTITLRAISDPNTFREYAKRVGHASGLGYWDSENNEVGIYIDKSLFQKAGYQAKWKGRNQGTYIELLRGYVTRLVMREIGHELFHAIQEQTDSPYYYFPLLVEGSALYVQYNIFQREELVTLSKAQLEIYTNYPVYLQQKMRQTYL